MSQTASSLITLDIPGALGVILGKITLIYMERFWPQRIVLLLFCTTLPPDFQVNAVRCDCRTKEEEDKTRDHLRLVTRISALKLLPTVREVIYQSGAEKSYLLDRTKYEVVRDLWANYGDLLPQTDIIPALELLLSSLRNLVDNDKDFTRNEIQLIVNASVSKFHSSVLPPAFLCFALGTCRLTDTILVYRRVDQILQALHNALITAEDQVTSECARRFTDVTKCPKCLTDNSVGYCRNSCQSAAYGCLVDLARRWETNIDELHELTRSYEEGFRHLVRGIRDGMSKLVETKAPKLAKVVVSSCGPRSKSDIFMESSNLHKPQKPKEANTKTKELVEQLRVSRKCWAQIADRTCSEASQQSHCWNGTNIVRVQLADDFSIGTKDVRPRPKETWLESSGHPYDTDDEDFIGGSGSGIPVEEVHDEAVYTIAPVQTSPATSSLMPPIHVDDATRLFPQILSWTALGTLLGVVLLLH